MFKALIVTGELGQLRYYEEVACRLKALNCQLGFCCDRDDAGVAEAIAKVASKYEMDFYHHKETGDSFTYTPNFIQSIVNKYSQSKLFPKSKRSKKFDEHISKAKLDLFRNIHFSRLMSANIILQNFKPDVIITGEDGIASDYWLLAAAKNLRIPVVVLPYGIADSSSLIYKGVEERHHRGELLTTADPAVRLVDELYPKWIKETQYGKVVYLPPEYILALEDLKIDIPHPWCFQGGQADILLLESETMYQRYLAEGINSKKMKLAGSVYCDVMYDVISKNKHLKVAFDKCQTINNELSILVCVPPSDHDGWNHRCAYSSVADFVVSLSKLFIQFKHLKVVYSFHPRMKEADRQELLALGINDYSGFPLYVIPECDILISCGSSLARWALAARKIVINFDLYNFGVNDFPNIAAYLQVNQITELTALIQRFQNEPAWYNEVLLKSKNDSDKMGLINGQATLTIFNIIKQRIKKSRLFSRKKSYFFMSN